MHLWELMILAVGLSMDAFAVSICKGLAVEKADLRACCTAGIWFGGFQALMPLAGYYLGAQFSAYIESVGHWIAFLLLAMIGLNMIREARGEADAQSASMSVRAMLPLAVATSIDALAVGVTFALLVDSILPAVCLIGLTTFVISAAGVKIGSLFGARWRAKAEICGGVILILLGLKIMLEHLGIL